MEMKCILSIEKKELELYVEMEQKARLLAEVQVHTMEVWPNGY